MDSTLYGAAHGAALAGPQSCDIEKLIRYEREIGEQVTPNNNTVLHVIAQFYESPDCICAKVILDMDEALLKKPNSNGDRPLHLAVRYGHIHLVRIMIIKARSLRSEIESGSTVVKEVLRLRNNKGDTILHEAIRSCNVYKKKMDDEYEKIVQILLDDDPELAHVVNSSGESPLYLALDRPWNDVNKGIVKAILEVCNEPIGYRGPEGRTALHASATWGSEPSDTSGSEGIASKLLEKDPSLNEEPDNSGFIALHYASRYGNVSIVQELMQANKSIAYITTPDKDKKRTALHIAACEGFVDIMIVILKHCPDCWEMVTSEGKNVLHLAVENEQENVLKFILVKKWAAHIINEKDSKGNTALHLYAASSDLQGLDLVKHPQVDKYVLNKQNLAPFEVAKRCKLYSRRKAEIENELTENDARRFRWDIINRDKRRRFNIRNYRQRTKNKIPVDWRKIADTHMIVAALIATVAFTAGFTIPGGFESENASYKGMAILSKVSSFTLFVIADVIAMASSVAAVLIYSLAVFYEQDYKVRTRVMLASFLTSVSMVAMVFAFGTALYSVLQKAPALATFQLLIGFSYFLVLYIALKNSIRYLLDMRKTL